jgi:DNA-binding NtrC family response regulator
LLVRYFAQQLSRQMRKNIEAIPAAATKALATWDWPGNFRELENLIERAVILWRGKSLEVPLAELRKLVINESANHNTQRGAEDSTRIVRETIGALNHRSLPRASAGPDNGRHDEIVRRSAGEQWPGWGPSTGLPHAWVSSARRFCRG